MELNVTTRKSSNKIRQENIKVLKERMAHNLWNSTRFDLKK